MIVQALDFSKECLYSDRPDGINVDTLVLHCIGYPTSEALEVFRQRKVSAHYIIDLDGRIIQLVNEDKSAWHAGQSFWRGRKALNYSSIGVELCSLSLGQEPFADCQINSLIGLCRQIIEKYSILPHNIIGHSDVAPERRPDPGRRFPWKELAMQGIGLWYDLQDSSKVNLNDDVKLLSLIGYDISNPNAARWAFCRHFLPHLIPYEEDIQHLVAHPFPSVFCIDDAQYLPILKAVAYQFDK